MCNEIKHSKYRLFADDVKIFRAIISVVDCILLQSDIECIQSWCTADCMKLNIAKLGLVPPLGFYITYKTCDSPITCTDTVEDLEVQLDSKLHIHGTCRLHFLPIRKDAGLDTNHNPFLFYRR